MVTEKQGSERRVIGWREWVGLPELGIGRVKAKIDTGARSSVLHAFDIVKVERRGRTFVEFKVHPVQRSARETVDARAELADERWVRNSGGRRELRPVIVTTLRLHEEEWPIELTLAGRDVMGFRMLLGRQAVRRKFLVDPGRSYLRAPRLRKKKTKRRDEEG